MGLSHNPRIVTDGLALIVDPINSRSSPVSEGSLNDLLSDSYFTLYNGTSGDSESVFFDGSNDYALLNDTNFGNDFGSEITVEAVFKRTVDDDFKRLVAKQVSGTTTNVSAFQLGIFDNNTFRWSVATDTAFVDGQTSTPCLKNVIYHFVGTYSGTEGFMRAYVNTSLILNRALTGTIKTSSEPLSLGSSYYNNSIQWFFGGNIYLVRIYSKSLSAAEITQNFNATRGRYGI